MSKIQNMRALPQKQKGLIEIALWFSKACKASMFKPCGFWDASINLSCLMSYNL